MIWLTSSAPLALAAAVLWGFGDFSGGMGVKRAGGSVAAALRIILISHTTSLCGLLLVLWIRRDDLLHGRPVLWALAAGIAGGLSLAAFYIALSRGSMGASAAVSGLLAAALPATLSSFVEGSPGLLRLAGFAIAGIAIWMIAAGPADPTRPVAADTMFLAIGAGGGFGVYFIALRMAGATGGSVLWPMTVARVGSLSTCALLVAVLSLTRARWAGPSRITRSVVFWSLLTAVGDTTGNLLFLAATRAGRLDIAAVLASLYPASTILLAGALLKERPSARQGWGMAVAAIAVVLITA